MTSIYDGPHHKPNVWVRVKVGNNNTEVIGKVLGLINSGKGWVYYVTNPVSPTPYLIKEEDILMEVK